MVAMATQRGSSGVAIPFEGLRINVGAGSRRPPGWFNVDIEENPDAPTPLDLLSDAKKIALPDECASELMAIHVAEHFYRWDLDDALDEWKRLLRPGGTLILELPDLIKSCINVIEGRMKGGKHPDQLGMWALFGDSRSKNPYMSHKYGYSPESLTAILVEHGFIKVKHLQTVFHIAGREHRDMRLECRKPAKG